MKYHLTLIILLTQLASCNPSARSALDSSTPTGALYQLLPFLFPQLRPSSSKAMKTYFIPQTGSSASIRGKEITLTVPYSTSLDSLVAEFYHTGITATVNAAEQVSGTTTNNYSANFTDQITAADRSILDYTIKTSKGTATSNDLLAFSLSTNPQINSFEGSITGSLVTVYVPYGTDISSLIATFSHNGKNVQVAGSNQTSGKNTQNFSSAVVYSVYSDTGTKQDYTVSVLVGGSDSKEIQAFWLNSTQGTIVGTDILVAVANGTDIKTLVASFISTGGEVRVGGKSTFSGESTLDYTNPVTFTVVAKDGSRKDYKISVNLVTSFSLGGSLNGMGSGKTLTLQNNGSNDLIISANSNFVFSIPVNYGSTYSVSIKNQPSSQTCTMTNGTGTVTSNVSNIIINCTPYGQLKTWYVDNSDFTIFDKSTELTWMKCSQGQNNDNSCTGTAGTYQFCASSACYSSNLTLDGSSGTSEIYNECNNLNTSPTGGYAGRTNWRVPTIIELQTLLDFSGTTPMINGSYFPNTLSDRYWSSIADSTTSRACTVYFNFGTFTCNSTKTTRYYLRCVSGP